MKELVSDLNKKKRLVKIGGSLDARKKHIKEESYFLEKE